jgi:hypothetical protein
MIRVDGREYPTVEDAAKEFHVSAKTVHSWINTGIIGTPPRVAMGVREVAVFPMSYMKKAKAQLEQQKKRRRSRGKKRGT